MSQSKKKRSTGPKSRPARSSTPARHGLRETRSTAESRLLIGFTSWYALHITELDEMDGHGEEDHGEPSDMRGMLGVLMDITRTLGPTQTLATPAAHTLKALIELVASVPADEGDSDSAGDDDDRLSAIDHELGVDARVLALVDVLSHYLDFLSETDSWRASDADFDASYAVLGQAEMQFDDAFESGTIGELIAAMDDEPTVATDEQLRALETLAIITGVDRFLDWLGQEQPVTEDGGLLLADIAPVAALIGLSVVGVEGQTTPSAGPVELGHEIDQAFDTLLGRAHSPAVPFSVGSLWDDGPLSTWWITLSQTGIVDVGDTTVQPGPDADGWRTADAAERLDARSGFIEQYVQEWFENEAVRDLDDTPSTLIRVFTMLTAGISPELHPELGTASIIDRVHEELELELSLSAGIRSAAIIGHLLAAGLLVAEARPDGTERYVVPEPLRPAMRRGILPTLEALKQR